MHISDINPHIRHAALVTEPFVMRHEPSICMDCRLFFFENISGSVRVCRKEYNILNNTAIFFPPETEYELNIEFHKNAGFYVFNFDLTNIHHDLKKGLGTPLKSEFCKTAVPSYELPGGFSKPLFRNLPRIKPILARCINNFILKNTFYRELSSSLLKMCILEFAGGEIHSAYSELCKNVLDYISEKYTDSSLTNIAIANHFNYHPYHLSNIIKTETGKTLHRFLIYYRLRRAKELLELSSVEIAEIAWKCGFASAAYFSEQFRKELGITPKQYRSKHRNTGF